MPAESKEVTEQIDWRGKATITGDLRLGRSEVLRSLRHVIPVGTKPRTSHHRLPGREKRRRRKCSTIFLERTRSYHQTNNIGTVSKATLWKLRRDEVDRIWAFPSAYIPS